MMYKNNNFLESRKAFDWILEARILGDPNSKIAPSNRDPCAPNKMK